MNSLIKHPDFGEVRVEVIKGEPWFCASDICEILDYTNNRKAISDHCREKGVTKRYTLTNGGKQEAVFINEGNLYRLILKSHMPAAEKFESWVCDEVLPSIRKYGYYIHPSYVLSRKEQNRQNSQYAQLLGKYLTHDDKQRIGRKYGATINTVEYTISREVTNNAMMRDLQERALANKEKELNAYHPDRINEIIKKLTR